MAIPSWVTIDPMFCTALLTLRTRPPTPSHKTECRNGFCWTTRPQPIRTSTVTPKPTSRTCCGASRPFTMVRMQTATCAKRPIQIAGSMFGLRNSSRTSHPERTTLPSVSMRRLRLGNQVASPVKSTSATKAMADWRSCKCMGCWVARQSLHKLR